MRIGLRPYCSLSGAKTSGPRTKPMRNVDTSPKRQRVMRSPKHAATGGAILSKFM